MNTLGIHNLSHAFGGLKAISDFNLTVRSNEIMGVIGPNGAGKTTLFNVLCGIYPAQQGSIKLNQQMLNGLSIDEITRAGIARTFQNIRLFKTLTVLENVKTAIRGHYPFFKALFRFREFQTQEDAITQQAYELLKQLGLENYTKSLAQDLPYGMQRRLEIARALAVKPKVLLLDEPACGMNHHEAQQLAHLIETLCREKGLAVILIDHQMRFVMSLCQQIVVLNFGKTIAFGNSETIRNDPTVIQAYLGST